ncbi:unnamed protein product [Ixodes pacificus]
MLASVAGVVFLCLLLRKPIKRSHSLAVLANKFHRFRLLPERRWQGTGLFL